MRISDWSSDVCSSDLGAERIDRLKVYDIALAQKDRSMAAVDLAGVRADLMEYGWIQDARVSRRLPDTLVVDIVERTPAAIWQHNGKLSLIDKKRSEEHTSELQSLMRISYAVFCLK